MTEQGEGVIEAVAEPIAPYAPRYIRHDGIWYVRRDHFAEQLKAAIESAFTDGVRFAAAPPPVKIRRGPNVMRKVVGEIMPQ